MKSLIGTLCKTHGVPRRTIFKMRKGKQIRGSVCDICHNTSETARYHRKPVWFKKWWLKKKYGIDLNQYNQLLKDQNDCCKICETHKSNFNKALAVDHCHESGKVRGLLCASCNTGLGQFKENSTLLGKAFIYLQRHD